MCPKKIIFSVSLIRNCRFKVIVNGLVYGLYRIYLCIQRPQQGAAIIRMNMVRVSAMTSLRFLLAVNTVLGSGSWPWAGFT